MKIFTIIFVCFALLGAAEISTSIHEYFHYWDFHNIDENFTNQHIYIAELPLPNNLTFNNIINTAGYYDFNYPVNEEKAVKKVTKYTELKAYGITILFSIFCGFLFIKFLGEING